MYQARVGAKKVIQDQENYNTDRSDAVQAATVLDKRAAAQALTKTLANQAAAKLLEDNKKAATALARGDSARSKVYVTPDGKNPINVDETKDGPVNSFTREPVDLNGLISHADYAQATNATRPRTGKGGKGKDGDAMSKVGDPDLMVSILDSDYLESATGFLDPKSIAGSFGYSAADVTGGDTREGPRIQALQSKMADIGIDSVKTNLEGLGINPTDKDLEVAFASIPDKNTQPLAWVIWTRDQYLPMLEKAAIKSVKEGTISQEDMDAYLADVRAGVERGTARYDADPTAPAAPSSTAFEDPAEEAEYQAYKASMGAK
jgi:hypothetical protein